MKDMSDNNSPTGSRRRRRFYQRPETTQGARRQERFIEVPATLFSDNPRLHAMRHGTEETVVVTFSALLDRMLHVVNKIISLTEDEARMDAELAEILAESKDLDELRIKTERTSQEFEKLWKQLEKKE